MIDMELEGMEDMELESVTGMVDTDTVGDLTFLQRYLPLSPC